MGQATRAVGHVERLSDMSTSPHSHKRYIEGAAIAQMQQVLHTVERMQPLPEAGSPEATAQHDAWMQQFHHLNDLEHDAEICALSTVPADVREMLNRVKDKVREMQGRDDHAARKQSSL